MIAIKSIITSTDALLAVMILFGLRDENSKAGIVAVLLAAVNIIAIWL